MRTQHCDLVGSGGKAPVGAGLGSPEAEAFLPRFIYAGRSSPWARCLFVRPSVKCVNCDKTKETAAEILISYEWPIYLVCWQEMAQNFRQKGWPPSIILLVKKIDEWSFMWYTNRGLWAQVSFLMSQCTRLTDGRTERLGNTVRCITCSLTLKPNLYRNVIADKRI